MTGCWTARAKSWACAEYCELGFGLGNCQLHIALRVQQSTRPHPRPRVKHDMKKRTDPRDHRERHSLAVLVTNSSACKSLQKASRHPHLLQLISGPSKNPAANTWETRREVIETVMC